jgi:ATP-dependent DNA helicase RecQ
LGDSARETLRRFRSGQSVEQIARERAVTPGTIYSHLAEGIEHGEPVELGKFFTMAELAEVASAFGRNGFGALGPVFESLGGTVDYGRLRIFRAATNAPK